MFSPNAFPKLDPKFLDNYVLPYNLIPNIWYQYGASVPEHYDYALVPIDYDYTSTDANSEVQNNLRGYRRFWDGGVLSNTPLRELIQTHQDYWSSANSGNSIPSLEIYIVDVWPTLDDYPLPLDLDGVRDRKNDLTYQDKTPYEEKVANLVSDYYKLSKELLELATSKGVPYRDINAVLSKKAKSKKRSGENRTFNNLLFKQFDIKKVVRIDRSPDTDDMSNKWFDFSSRLLKRSTGCFKHTVKSVQGGCKLLTSSYLKYNIPNILNEGILLLCACKVTSFIHANN